MISRSFISLVFLSLLMLSSRDFADWIKLPKAIEHYMHHSAEDGLDFAAFFKMHYLDDVKVDDDFEKDMELPFKSDSGSLQSLVSNVVLPSDRSDIAISSVESYVINSSMYIDPILSDPAIGSIWQPPRKA